MEKNVHARLCIHLSVRLLNFRDGSLVGCADAPNKTVWITDPISAICMINIIEPNPINVSSAARRGSAGIQTERNELRSFGAWGVGVTYSSRKSNPSNVFTELRRDSSAKPRIQGQGKIQRASYNRAQSTPKRMRAEAAEAAVKFLEEDGAVLHTTFHEFQVKTTRKSFLPTPGKFSGRIVWSINCVTG